MGEIPVILNPIFACLFVGVFHDLSRPRAGGVEPRPYVGRQINGSGQNIKGQVLPSELTDYAVF